MRVLLAFLIFTPLYLIWLLVCAVLSFIGVFIPLSNKKLQPTMVQKRQTVCRVMNEKGLLSDHEYSFETEVVASQYDEFTFSGYLVILGPVILLLKHFAFLDSFMMALIRQWMRVHSFREDAGSGSPVPRFLVSLAAFCVGIARSFGKVLYVLSWGRR